MNPLVRIPAHPDDTVTLAPGFDFRAEDWRCPMKTTLLRDGDKVTLTNITFTPPYTPISVSSAPTATAPKSRFADLMMFKNQAE